MYSCFCVQVGVLKVAFILQFIANDVCDNLGDIARTDYDHFGLYVESTYATLVASISSFGMDHEFTLMCYPLFRDCHKKLILDVILKAVDSGFSGGHINPVVTFGLFLARKLSLTRTLYYVVAQCLGLICGAGVVRGSKEAGLRRVVEPT
ncbi:hypothetical protein L6452_09292 [Arctium lappa]|uniref:Uncharacterized protein n=1 Tax=Arctium lappa TaxID=4217 RepID=A0ACB9DJY3_ARCLA|nr:hypothetical protein L6452_09292 [Arctium lappa]